MKRFSLIPTMSALVLLVSCQAAPSEPQSTTEKEEGGSISMERMKETALRSSHWIRNSAEYQAIFRQTYNIATERVRGMIEGREPGTWVVALDADETVISNERYEWELQTNERASTPELWEAWVKRQEAPPLPGVIEFFEKVHEWGGRIAIVTNRSLRDCPDTEANFKKFGISYDVMLCRGEDSRKEARWESIRTGKASPDLPPLEILLWIGDNIRDFPGMDQDLRFKDAENYSLFGTKYLVTPNPIYGSWKENPAE